MFDLISVALSFFAIAVSPGPANMSNATIAMSQGRKTSLIYGAGLSTGLVFWGIIAASGLGIILQDFIQLLIAVKICGGIYLMWLAFLSINEAIHPQDQSIHTETESNSYLKWFIKGIILNVSNPKTIIAWLTALSAGVETTNNTTSLVLGVIVCIFVGFLTNAMYSLSFSLSCAMSWYQKASRWINGIVSGLFAIAGFELIHSAFTEK